MVEPCQQETLIDADKKAKQGGRALRYTNCYEPFSIAPAEMVPEFYDAYTYACYRAMQGAPIGSRMGKTFELIGFSYKHKSSHQAIARQMAKYGAWRKFNSEFADQLAAAVWNGDKTLDNVTLASERSKSFVAVPEGYADNVSVLYGPKFLSQLDFVIGELELENSRRAQVLFVTPDDQQLVTNLELQHLEYSCTTSWQLFKRGDTLSLHVHMRSQNIGLLMPLDSYVQAYVLQKLCDMLSLKFGSITVSIGSAHVYELDTALWEAMDDA